VKNEIEFDFGRLGRIGLSEAVLCEGKSAAQIQFLIQLARSRETPLLMTRLAPELFQGLPHAARQDIDYDQVSRTAILGPWEPPSGTARICIAAAGSSDVPVAREVLRTLAFHGEVADEIVDIGVAGLWRVLQREQQLKTYPIVVVVAGMDGALFSVVGGLVSGLVIAVPTSRGYGTSYGGQTALHSALSSCAPGVVSVNIENGYGAACAALRAVRQFADRKATGEADSRQF
jgi:NCAIR mutase (PurE)-related protein